MKEKKVIEFNLDERFDYKIIKSLNEQELKVLAEELRAKIIEACSIYGGHLASNLGVVELIIALFRHYDLSKDKLIFDVGHQCYAFKILTGRPLTNLRQEDGIDGFPRNEESNLDLVNVGHSSTSISEAMGFALTRDLKKEKYEVISLIGDSSIANGLSFEALNNLGDFNHKVIVILNDNEMSIARPTGGFNRLLQTIRISPKYIKNKERYRNILNKTKVTKWIYNTTRTLFNKTISHLFSTNIFEDLGLYYYGVIDGHNFESLERSFSIIDKVNKPILLHVATKKGKGYSYSENDVTGKWHAVGPFEIKSGLSKSNSSSNWPKVYSNLLFDAMKDHLDIISITPATGYGSYLEKIKDNYPERYFDVGISEEHALTFAAGIANSSYHPYVTIYSTFLQRSYDEILHDVCYMDLKVTLLIDHAGLVGQDGATHQGIFDASFLYTIPNMTIAMAKDEVEAKKLFDFSLSFNHPLAIRFTKSNDIYSNSLSNSKIELGKWEILNKSNKEKICLISYGPHINEFVGLDNITLINALFIKPIDEELLRSLLNYKYIVIYDPYGTKVGFTNEVITYLNSIGYKNQIITRCLPSTFIKKGTINEQERRYLVDTKSIKELLNELK